MDARDEAFAATRPLLFAIAYRMLGSAADAEDLVQDAYLRWRRAPDGGVRTPAAYLTTVVTRLAINQLRAAKVRRDAYLGPWLPEPIVTGADSDPAAPVELADSLSMAFLVLLERLSPVERAVFLLREVFELDYAEVARVVDKSETNCRQLFARAKKRLDPPRPRFAADPERARRLVERFTSAVGTGDLDALLEVLAEDITLWADRGDHPGRAPRKPVHGAHAVARFLLGVARDRAADDRRVRAVEINGQPGLVTTVGGRIVVALVFDVRDEKIRAIYAIANPEKLGALAGPAD